MLTYAAYLVKKIIYEWKQHKDWLFTEIKDDHSIIDK